MTIKEFINEDIKIVSQDEYIKELKEEINKLTAESTEWEERTYCWQDRAEDLQIIIDKAIEYIKNDMYVEPKELYGLVDGEHLLNILKGDNK